MRLEVKSRARSPPKKPGKELIVHNITEFNRACKAISVPCTTSFLCPSTSHRWELVEEFDIHEALGVLLGATMRNLADEQFINGDRGRDNMHLESRSARLDRQRPARLQVVTTRGFDLRASPLMRSPTHRRPLRWRSRRRDRHFGNGGSASAHADFRARRRRSISWRRYAPYAQSAIVPRWGIQKACRSSFPSDGRAITSIAQNPRTSCHPQCHERGSHQG